MAFERGEDKQDFRRRVAEVRGRGQVHEDRAETLRRVLDEEAVGGLSLWASFNWTERVDLGEALRQQGALGDTVRGTQLMVKTAVLEDTAEVWTLKEQRKAQEAHAGAIWLTERGPVLGRVTPLPMA